MDFRKDHHVIEIIAVQPSFIAGVSLSHTF